MKSTIIQRMLFPLICTLLIFSCTKKQEVELNQIQKNIIVGFSQIGAESAWRTCNTQSMRDAASASGIQLLYDNAEQKQENQIKAIRSFIVYQVDVIVFVPIVQDGWDNVLREAKDAGIPVIIIDRKMRVADESLFTAYIGADHVEEGRDHHHRAEGERGEAQRVGRGNAPAHAVAPLRKKRSWMTDSAKTSTVSITAIVEP